MDFEDFARVNEAARNGNSQRENGDIWGTLIPVLWQDCAAKASRGLAPVTPTPILCMPL